VVSIWEVGFFSSALELNKRKGSSGVSVISEVDEMPLLDFCTVFDQFVDVRVASTNQISVGVGC
jgi:hypothetical protein